MKENSREELEQRLEELYRTQHARLDVGADDLDIREEIAEVEEEIKELQDDTNVIRENSLEKDEEILNNIKAYMQENIDKGYHKFVYNDLGYDEKCVDVINAIEHILSSYKRVLKENEEWQKTYQEEKDKEFEIIRKNQELEKRWDNDTHKLQNDLDIANAKIVELQKELNQENKKCMMLAIEKQDYFEKYRYHLQQNERLTKEFSNVIPVQKVKNKIEEIVEKIKYEENEKVVIYLHKQKNILQELLESEE